MSNMQEQQQEIIKTRQQPFTFNPSTQGYVHSFANNTDLSEVESKTNCQKTVAAASAITHCFEFTEVFVWGDDSKG